MVSNPADRLVTMPVAEPIVAIIGFVLCQWPPVAASLSVVVPPMQIEEIPEIGDKGLTVRFRSA